MSVFVAVILLISLEFFLNSNSTRDFALSNPLAQSSTSWKHGWTVSDRYNLSFDASGISIQEARKIDFDFKEHLLYEDSDFHILSDILSWVSWYRLPQGTALTIPHQACDVKLVEEVETKFFHEIYMTWHLDSRFGRKIKDRDPPISDDERTVILKRMFRYWSDFADSRFIPYNIAHGVLLGWTWGQKIMPWDDDLDVQVPSEYLNVLLSLSNQTYYGRYLLEVNPSFNLLSPDKKTRNTVEARFIDTKSGFFIDITGLYTVENRDDSTGHVMIGDKNGHTYRINNFYPLIRTSFEGIQTWIPFNTTQYLTDEYGKQGTPASHKYTPYPARKGSKVREKVICVEIPHF